MTTKFTILGCGNSYGVPMAGNHWGACDPNEPKNCRARCSVAVQSETTTLIIDTGADFRQQMNDFDIAQIDAVLYTHQHSDHCHGIDDLRPYYFRNNKTPLNVYGNTSALEEIVGRFDYLFKGGAHVLYPPIVEARPFEEQDYGEIQIIGDIDYIPFEIDHGTCKSVGYRFGDISYCVDMKSLDDTALDIIRGSRIWIVDGAGYQSASNPVHVDLETLYTYNDVIKAESVYITCLTPHMDYQTLASELPQGFHPTYDGLQFTSGA